MVFSVVKAEQGGNRDFTLPVGGRPLIEKWSTFRGRVFPLRPGNFAGVFPTLSNRSAPLS